MPLYEIAVTKRATKKEIDAGAAAEELVLKPDAIIAKSPEVAGMMAVRRPEVSQYELDQLDVHVRPFA